MCRYGQTALHVACATGARSTAVALMLIEACTDNSKLEMKDFYGGKTPLHAAARGGNAAVTKALCDR